MHIDHRSDQAHPVAGARPPAAGRPPLTETCSHHRILIGVQQPHQPPQERIPCLNIQRQQNKWSLDGNASNTNDYKDVQLIEKVGDVELRMRRITENVQTVGNRRCAIVQDDVQRERERDGGAKETVESAVYWSGWFSLVTEPDSG